MLTLGIREIDAHSEQRFREAVDKLKALVPPAAIRDVAEAWVDTLELQAAAFLVLLDAAGDDSATDLDDKAVRLERASERVNQLGTELGITACNTTNPIDR